MDFEQEAAAAREVAQADIPKYKVLEPTFIAPHLIQPGKIILYDGEPGPHLEPLNQPAQDMMDAYYKAKPEASINPVSQLPLTMGAAVVPTVHVVGEAAADPILSFVDMAANGAPGATPSRVMTLAEAQLRGG